KGCAVFVLQVSPGGKTNATFFPLQRNFVYARGWSNFASGRKIMAPLQTFLHPQQENSLFTGNARSNRMESPCFLLSGQFFSPGDRGVPSIPSFGKSL